MSRKNKNHKDKNYIGKKFEAIHISRELAVQFLYSLDMNPEKDFAEALDLFLSVDDYALAQPPEVKQRFRDLVNQVWERKNELDGLLLRIVTGWRPERMVSVDKNILRLLLLEGFLLKTLPVKVAITEASILANNFGTKDSARFVNGVMYKVAKFFEEKEEEE